MMHIPGLSMRFLKTVCVFQQRQKKSTDSDPAENMLSLILVFFVLPGVVSGPEKNETRVVQSNVREGESNLPCQWL